MKKIILFTLVSASGLVSAQTYVEPHIRSDGTFVQGHVRSTPNNTRMDNYGARDNIYGNSNPMTGQRGSQRSELSPTDTNTNNNYGTRSNSGGYRLNR